MVSKEIMAAFDERFSELKKGLRRNLEKMVADRASDLIRNTESFSRDGKISEDDLKGVIATLAAMCLQEDSIERETYEFVTEFNHRGTCAKMVQALSELYTAAIDEIAAAVAPLAEKMNRR